MTRVKFFRCMRMKIEVCGCADAWCLLLMLLTIGYHQLSSTIINTTVARQIQRDISTRSCSRSMCDSFYFSCCNAGLLIKVLWAEQQLNKSAMRECHIRRVGAQLLMGRARALLCERVVPKTFSFTAHSPYRCTSVATKCTIHRLLFHLSLSSIWRCSINLSLSIQLSPRCIGMGNARLPNFDDTVLAGTMYFKIMFVPLTNPLYTQ